jgi:hypothetical protein
MKQLILILFIVTLFNKGKGQEQDINKHHKRTIKEFKPLDKHPVEMDDAAIIKYDNGTFYELDIPFKKYKKIAQIQSTKPSYVTSWSHLSRPIPNEENLKDKLIQRSPKTNETLYKTEDDRYEAMFILTAKFTTKTVNESVSDVDQVELYDVTTGTTFYMISKFSFGNLFKTLMLGDYIFLVSKTKKRLDGTLYFAPDEEYYYEYFQKHPDGEEFEWDENDL